MFLCFFYFLTFGIGIDFSYDFLDFFQFQVNDVIHNALGQCHMLFE